MTERRIGYFVDHDNGTVTDTRTGVMWMRSALGQSWQGGTCCGTANTYSLNQLTALFPYCYASYDNWRLPTQYELAKIVTPTVIPSLDNEVFPNQSGKYFWSSTPCAEHAEHALVVSLYSGKIGSVRYDAGNCHVRLVREDANLSGGCAPFSATGYEDFDGIRKALEPRFADWTHRSPSTLLGQGKWLLTHPIDLEATCMALKLLSMSHTNEANYLLANFYLAHASEQGLIAFLTHEEWNAAGVSAGKAFANEHLNETADHGERRAPEVMGAVHDYAVALVQAAIDPLRKNPTAFLPELSELQSSVLANNVATPSQVPSNEDVLLTTYATPLVQVARWLLDQESVTFVALRAYLLPLNLLPRAVIDELNERALDLTDEPVLEEQEDTVLVAREILTQMLACWDSK